MILCGHCDRPQHDIPKCGKPAKYRIKYPLHEDQDPADLCYSCAEHGEAFMKRFASIGFKAELINPKLEVMK